MRIFPLVTLLAATACGAATPPASSPGSTFLENVTALCGRAFEGRITANEPAQAGDPFDGQRLVMHVRTCEPDRVLIPFHVGEDRSRTWVLSRQGDQLRLKHDHRHEDGTEDELTQYGGDTASPGTDARQEFPADQHSIDLFTRTDRAVSNTNVWAMEMHPGRLFAYELRRPGRVFRVEFDLTRAVDPPPAPWGHQ
jgi:hypothetical protein